MSGLGLDGWEPAEQHQADLVPAGPAEALHGLLDAPGPPPGPGDPLPPLWHWLAFLPRVPQSELGEDGHPAKGGFLPPVPLPRRMFAGARLSFAAPLRVAEAIERRSAVVSVDEKRGRSGALVFVKVRHHLWAGGAEAVTEEQDIVYREPAPPAAAAPAPSTDTAGTAGWAWEWTLGIDPTVLFRFSALTYNAHRIHYDRSYATHVEGYPGLVVHGPLQAVALAELCRRHLPDRPLAAFRFRSLSPAFDDGPLLLRGTPAEDGRVVLAAFDHRGQRTMEAGATVGASTV